LKLKAQRYPTTLAPDSSTTVVLRPKEPTVPTTSPSSHDNESSLASARLVNHVPALGLVDGHTAKASGSCKSGRGVADQVGNMSVRRKHENRFVRHTEIHPSTSARRRDPLVLIAPRAKRQWAELLQEDPEKLQALLAILNAKYHPSQLRARNAQRLR
jgi:hypothetical protein